MSQSLTHLLHRARQALDAKFHAGPQTLVTPRQLIVLQAIAANPGCSQVDLTVACGIDRSTIGDIVHRLCRHGFARRVRFKDDKRAYEVRLTTEGRSALNRDAPRLARADEHALSQLPAARRRQIIDDLQAIVRSIEVQPEAN